MDNSRWRISKDNTMRCPVCGHTVIIDYINAPENCPFCTAKVQPPEEKKEEKKDGV
jgi:rubrerythrin